MVSFTWKNQKSGPLFCEQNTANPLKQREKSAFLSFSGTIKNKFSNVGNRFGTHQEETFNEISTTRYRTTFFFFFPYFLAKSEIESWGAYQLQSCPGGIPHVFRKLVTPE